MFDTGGLFAVFALGMGLLLFLVWTAIVFVARPKCFYPKSFYPIWIGVPVLGLVVLICLGAGISFYQSLPSVVFRDSVGFDPTSDITIVYSLRHEPIDWDDSYLEFYASDSTINQILQNGFVPIRPTEIIEDTYCMPYWWNPPTGQRIRIYATNTDDPEFQNKDFRWSVSHKLLIYDPGSGDPSKRLVYFRYRRH